jgi:hypothetical protein
MAKFIVEAFDAGVVTLRAPGSNYRNSFVVSAESAAPAPGARVRGTIYAPAWKVDRVDLGGNYVEPLVGRPRRMQGTILAVNPRANELVVQVGYEATVRLPDRYLAADYRVGERIGWDNVEVPTFVPEAVAAEAGA